MRLTYKKIIQRLFNNNISIGNIYSMKSKQNVLDIFGEWRSSASHLNKCYFIVDKDFDFLKGFFIPSDQNLIELEYYTIENYLISKAGTMALLQSKIFDKEEAELEDLLNWESWKRETYSSLKELFIVYAIANKFELAKNCSISPYVYLKKKSYLVDTNKVLEYINKIKELCSEANIDFDSEYQLVESYYKEGNGYKYNSLIKGKYIYAAMFKYLHHITGSKIDEDLATLIIADNISLDNLTFIKDKLA